MKQIIIKTLLCMVMAAGCLNANAQVKAFEKYADMKNVTYVFISKYMFGMAGRNVTPSVPGIDTQTLLNKLTGIQIISSENKVARTKLRDDVKAMMTKGKYEVLMQMNEDDSKVNIFHSINRQRSAVVMLIEDSDEVTVMVFSGKFTLEDVMKLTEE
ncbi:MAG: DUF4252 domain-containing protein [Prevotella sp.]|nr:DUF4252 domain-containing protein [Prevotella sp.]